MRTLKQVEKDIYSLLDEANKIILDKKNEDLSFRLFVYLQQLKDAVKDFFVNCDGDIKRYI